VNFQDTGMNCFQFPRERLRQPAGRFPFNLSEMTVTEVAEGFLNWGGSVL
jgi:hypothetical protein